MKDSDDDTEIKDRRLCSGCIGEAFQRAEIEGLTISIDEMADRLSVLSLLAAIATITAEHLIRLNLAGNTSLIDLYTKLTNQMYELRLTGERLRAFLKRDTMLEEPKELEGLIAKANEICGLINVLKHELFKKAAAYLTKG
jgi:hypothetical protein